MNFRIPSVCQTSIRPTASQTTTRVLNIGTSWIWAIIRLTAISLSLYSPWEKSIVGWKQPTLLSDTEAKQIKLEPYDKASDAYKIIANSQGEYLLLQNIRNEGWYKEALGYGLLVWRIDYDDLPSVNLGIIPTTRQVSQGS